MKYFYTTFILLCSLSLYSQQLYWVGGSSGNWSDAANWSATSGGAGGAGAPATANYAVFNSSADVTIDFTTTTIQGLHVLNGSNVKLIANAGATLNLTNTTTNIATAALYVAANSSLIDTMTVAGIGLDLNLNGSAHGYVDGTFAVVGIPGTGLPPTIGNSKVSIGSLATLEFRNNSVFRQSSSMGTTAFTPEKVNFLAGSTHLYNAVTAGGLNATYANTSTIYIYGTPNTAIPTINTAVTSIGNLVIDIQGYAGNAAALNNKGFVLNNNFNINGDLTVRNTGGQPLIFAPISTSNFQLNLNANFIIEPNAQTVLGSYNDHTATYNLAGNLIMTGGFLYFRHPKDVTNYTNPVTLKVLGNISQTGGTITTNNATVSDLEDELFVIEMAGTTAQTINAAGNWDNDLQNIVLRMNNANGVNLNSHLSVSKLSWNSTNKGNINTTAANPLTILNPSTTDLTVYNGVSNAGYVNGPVRRVTNSAAPYVFPTGNNGVYRSVSVLPETVTTSTYEAQYYNGAHPNPTLNPLMNGISLEEYWRVSRTSGSTLASVQLTLNGAIAGTNSNDGLVVASYNGSQWNSEYTGVTSSMIIPGNSAAGTVQTEYIAPNRFYTFGFGTATTLPIHLLGFNVEKVNQQDASITWEVSAESTPVSFVVERSTNGVAFNAIGTVQATTATQYQYQDTRLPNGKIYYRLKMIDQDGSAIYTDILSILVSNNDSKLQIFPTVTQSQTQLKLEVFKTSKVTLLVSDNNGRIVQRNAYTLNAGTQFISINASSLSNGVYYAVVLFEDGTSAAPQRFVKQ